MSSRLHWRLLLLTRKLWFRAAAFSVLAVATALLAIVLEPYIPADLSVGIGAAAVDKILSVLASSMLAVTIFSLSTMVTAYVLATSTVTPRAFRLLIADNFTQNALASFVGAFLFSLVGLIALSTGLYDVRGRLVLFVVTIGLIVFIVATLLRWIDHVSRLGQVANTADRVEAATCEAMRERLADPHLGGRPLRDADSIPDDAVPVHGQRIGYVQHIDMHALAEVAGRHQGASVHVGVLPGAFVDPSRALAWLDGAPDADQHDHDQLRTAFTLDDLRSFDQDPRFGASVLSEIASRALSPAVNDPGTAIDIIGRGVRLLSTWAHPSGEGDVAEVHYPAVYVPGIGIDELFDDLFRPIARDGAALIEVCIRLQKALRSLARSGDPRFVAAARLHSQLALERALPVLTTQRDRQLLRDLGDEIAAIE